MVRTAAQRPACALGSSSAGTSASGAPRGRRRCCTAWWTRTAILPGRWSIFGVDALRPLTDRCTTAQRIDVCRRRKPGLRAVKEPRHRSAGGLARLGGLVAGSGDPGAARPSGRTECSFLRPVRRTSWSAEAGSTAGSKRTAHKNAPRDLRRRGHRSSVFAKRSGWD